jgi:hypothetical protein
MLKSYHSDRHGLFTIVNFNLSFLSDKLDGQIDKTMLSFVLHSFLRSFQKQFTLSSFQKTSCYLLSPSNTMHFQTVFLILASLSLTIVNSAPVNSFDSSTLAYEAAKKALLSSADTMLRDAVEVFEQEGATRGQLGKAKRLIMSKSNKLGMAFIVAKLQLDNAKKVFDSASQSEMGQKLLKPAPTGSISASSSPPAPVKSSQGSQKEKLDDSELERGIQASLGKSWFVLFQISRATRKS